MGSFVGISIALAVVAAWLTHIADCFISHSWGLLIAGAIFFPVGIVHGFGVWCGFWS
ncbi:hypothetical protein BGLT_05219 [Caballeronia glathei]|uniref:hypothetical protein n=1 Tax=Caballeronia glathei TaxID=60547 RepID=UPI0005034F22|nr:hypothetical protein [Caballeronia glathei]CDY76146.1 hypothetical protein BGLT_05219 [Caballeronia glathei]